MMANEFDDVLDEVSGRIQMMCEQNGPLIEKGKHKA